MKTVFHAARLDLKAFAQDGSTIEGEDPLSGHERLMAETPGQGGDAQVAWAARASLRAPQGGEEQVWLHLEASVRMPLICQRCMEPVEVDVAVNRYFRFVADEETALAEDDESEEDLLVFSKQFNLAELVEDELLMELPAVPRHDVCPVTPKLAVTDPEFEEASAAKPNPFAVLQKLRGDKAN
jgi:uncharacterized protein